ncbi:MAG: rRNA (guanine527-N7)-methyltransferase [Clostridiales bacterium]|nr:rRNA (guanine527-N7)-methyltransferase [Clostridiales bacterium]
MDKIGHLKEVMQGAGITLDQHQCMQFMEYYQLLIEWNEFMNLTAITEFEEVVNKHFLDSLQLVLAIDLSKKKRILDLGTGAGFPGIPLKIMFPDLKMTLLDSLNKRINFLNEVICRIGLSDIETLHGRAEDYGRKEDYRESYDICVSRAVANLATLSEYCLPYVKKGGYFVPYKSGDIHEEINASKRAVELLGGKIQKIHSFTLPNTDIERSLIVINKVKETPKKYPRMAGKPSKEPIK